MFKQVFKGSSKRKKGIGQEVHEPPECPPSPDLSGLNEDEIAVLKNVFKREEEFESEVGNRQQ